MELIGKVDKKAGHGHGVKIGGVWYTIKDNVVPYLQKIEEGATVKVVWEKEGKYKKIVSHIEVSKEETTTSEKSSGEKKTTTYSKADNSSNNSYINRQSALKSAAAILSSAGIAFESPQDVVEATLLIANAFADWIEAGS